MIYNFDELNFQILSVTSVEHQSGVFNVDGRPYASLSYRVKGSAEFDIDGQKYISNSGDISYIPSEVSYKVKYTGGEIIVIHFSECNYRYPETAELKNSDYVKQKFSAMLDSWKKKHAPLEIKAITYKTLQQIAEINANAEENEMFSQMVEYVNQHFSEPSLEVGDIANAFYTSVATVRRRFTEKAGMSPKQYIIKVRLENAVDLLATGRHTAKAVAYMCGFSDEKYFSRIIKEKYGKSPSELKQRLFI